MFLAVIIVIFSLSLLVILHEFGHFFFARKFGVKVEEFGIGIPPRIFSKKIGETVYSLNLIPLGGFVRIYGEESNNQKANEPFSFASKKSWQKAMIILGGVVSFWLISLILYFFVFGLGARTVVGDETNPKYLNPKVQIVSVVKSSTADRIGLRAGDIILEVFSDKERLKVDKINEFLNFISTKPNKKIELTFQRGNKIIKKEFVLKEDPKTKKALLGVYVQRTAVVKIPWHKAFFESIKTTANMTKSVFLGYLEIFKSLLQKRNLPEGTEIMGPIGVGAFLVGAVEFNFVYFLQILAGLSIFLAVFNLLPVPALDGGQLLFLGIEVLRRKPINERIKKNINSAFFLILILLMVFVTIKDITNLF